MDATQGRTIDGITVTAFGTGTSGYLGRGLEYGRHYVECSFPDENFDRMSYFRPFDTPEAAAEEAKALAARINAVTPKGTYMAWSKPRLWKPGDVAARAKVQRIADEWAQAGPSVTIKV